MLFDYKEDLIFTKANADSKGIDPTFIEERRKSVEYGDYEISIIKALYRFQFLNLFNINRYMKWQFPDRKDNYEINVSKLYDDGVLNAYVGENVIEDSGMVLKVYTLSKGAYEYMIKRHTKTYSYNSVSKSTTPEILEKLSVNQYHISFIANNSVKYEMPYYQKEFREMGSVVIPSYIKYRGRTYIGIPLYRNDVAEFMNKIIKVVTALDDETRPVIVLTASSSKEALDTCQLLQSIKDFPFTCYCIDMESKELNVRKCLKKVKFIDGKAQIMKLS